ncbi:MAG: diadenosine tetraphosphatase [Xanthomonadaceae bacterium]|nr:diadenosine tetraphosphatase [Xanthomonadaceae bacterium]
MATYAIGDVQGCCDALSRLLDSLHFDPAADQLWFAGDLVNRGPQSAATLRLIRSLGRRAVTVLGNHDLHLLAVAHGGKRGRRDTLDDILDAPDRDELLDWLRRQPLIHGSADGRWQMLHAGLPPQWTLDTAVACAREVEAALQGPDVGELLDRMYGNQPDRWDPALPRWPRLRFIINCFTRLRYCTPDGQVAADPKGAPGSQPDGLVPWFEAPGRGSAGTRIVFGHWSTLGQVHWPEARVWGLDTGCVWGGRLSALRLDDEALFSIDCAAYRTPGVEGD